MQALTGEIYRPKRGIRWGTIARHFVLVVLCLWVILPVSWVFLLSIKSLPDSTHWHIWPKDFADPIWAHYEFMIVMDRYADPFIAALKNSLLVSGLTLISITTVAVLGGYALVHLRTPGKQIITSILVASLFFPTSVTAFIGIYNIQDSLGLINKTWSLFLPYTALAVALSLFIMRGMFQQVPQELIDSAKIDGASSLRTLFGVVLPLVRNGVVVVVIVNFTAAWGEFLLALTLMNDRDQRTLGVFVGTVAGGFGAPFWAQAAAMYLICFIPALIIFLIAQHWYMKGLQEGAMKG